MTRFNFDVISTTILHSENSMDKTLQGLRVQNKQYRLGGIDQAINGIL